MQCFSSNFSVKSFYPFVSISLWVKDGTLLRNISMVFWRCNREERTVSYKKAGVYYGGKGVIDKRKKKMFMQEWHITTIVSIFISKKQHPFDITDVFEDERLVLRLWYKCKSRIPSSKYGTFIYKITQSPIMWLLPKGMPPLHINYHKNNSFASMSSRA